MSYTMLYWETGRMRDETTKQAAQEFLAAKLAEEGQKHEDKLNKETAVARSPPRLEELQRCCFRAVRRVECCDPRTDSYVHGNSNWRS
jgi:hypothetical protein